MNTLKSFFLVLFISGLMSFHAYTQDDFANVDEVYDLIKGDWYHIIEYNGMTGKQDSVYWDYLHQIERIPETDSITWKIWLYDSLLVSSTYKIEYTLVHIFNRNKWMLNSRWTRLIIYKTNYGFSTAWDARDGGGSGYAREKLTTSINNSLQNNSMLSLFPNPTINSFIVTGMEDVKQIKVLDTNGLLLQSTAGREPVTKVDISALSNGIYVVQVISKSGIHTGKIIKNE